MQTACESFAKSWLINLVGCTFNATDTQKKFAHQHKQTPQLRGLYHYMKWVPYKSNALQQKKMINSNFVQQRTIIKPTPHYLHVGNWTGVCGVCRGGGSIDMVVGLSPAPQKKKKKKVVWKLLTKNNKLKIETNKQNKIKKIGSNYHIVIYKWVQKQKQNSELHHPQTFLGMPLAGMIELNSHNLCVYSPGCNLGFVSRNQKGHFFFIFVTFSPPFLTYFALWKVTSHTRIIVTRAGNSSQ